MSSTGVPLARPPRRSAAHRARRQPAPPATAPIGFGPTANTWRARVGARVDEGHDLGPPPDHTVQVHDQPKEARSLRDRRARHPPRRGSTVRVHLGGGDRLQWHAVQRGVWATHDADRGVLDQRAAPRRNRERRATARAESGAPARASPPLARRRGGSIWNCESARPRGGCGVAGGTSIRRCCGPRVPRWWRASLGSGAPLSRRSRPPARRGSRSTRSPRSAGWSPAIRHWRIRSAANARCPRGRCARHPRDRPGARSVKGGSSRKVRWMPLSGFGRSSAMKVVTPAPKSVPPAPFIRVPGLDGHRRRRGPRAPRPRGPGGAAVGVQRRAARAAGPCRPARRRTSPSRGSREIPVPSPPPPLRATPRTRWPGATTSSCRRAVARSPASRSASTRR